MKTIYIINHYAGNQYFDKGGRHYNFSKYLKRKEYNPIIFCCNAKHNSKSEIYFPEDGLWNEHIEETLGIPFVFVKGRAYEGNGKQRVMNMIDFYLNVQKAAESYAAAHGKPDVILGSSVHPLACVEAIKLAKKFNCKQIVEIRDLWPESIVAYGVASKKNALVQILYRLEKWIYTKADAIVFTMEGGKDYIIEKGWDTEHGGPVDLKKVHYINNGVDLEMFDYNKEHYTVEDEDLESPDIFKVVYTGSIRKVNNVGVLLNVAKKLQNPKVKFLIWGDGDELATLKQRVVDEKIDNVVFKGKVAKSYVPYIVSHADLNLIHGEQSVLMRFGISPNKLFDYFAAGKPILMDFSSPYNPAVDFDCGYVVENEDGMVELLNRESVFSEEMMQRFSENSRKAAVEYDFKRLTEKLIQVIEG